jgi:Cytochrome c/c1 heme lyase
MADKCPIDHANMSPEELAKFASSHGMDSKHNTVSKIPETSQQKQQSQCPVDHEALKAAAPDSKCPVTDPEAFAMGAGLAPHKDAQHPWAIEFVDPRNNMPAANQGITPGQKYLLSTKRVVSNIPKDGSVTPVHQAEGESGWVDEACE